ncbi:hypothetical protein LTR10_011132 [Elasticomyces elasticus]|nr:hypothetical protein LTR10_011132 [Elasticomyces elasticus]KAK4966448.1 hypothetical protein LTR42_011613 [Elasticomyces elasticus]
MRHASGPNSISIVFQELSWKSFSRNSNILVDIEQVTISSKAGMMRFVSNLAALATLLATVMASPLPQSDPTNSRSWCTGPCKYEIQLFSGADCTGAGAGSGLLGMGPWIFPNGGRRYSMSEGYRFIVYLGGTACGGTCSLHGTGQVITLYDADKVYMGDLNVVLGYRSACFTMPKEIGHRPRRVIV